MANETGNEEVISDELALAFMFAVHASVDDDEGVLAIHQPRRNYLIDQAINQIVALFEVELAIPVVRGKFRGPGATVIYLDKPDFSQHTKLYDPNSFGVLDIHYEMPADGGERIYAGFDAYVRLGESNTWLCVGIKPPVVEDDDPYDDIEDEEDHGEEITQDEKERIAVIVANSHGFRELKNREQRMAFAKPIIDKERDGKEWNTYLRPEHEIAQMAAELHELGITPMRAKALSSEGKTAAEIGKLLGISKQKAERAIVAEIPQYIADQLMSKQ